MPYSARGRTSRPLRVGPRLGSIGVGGMRFGPGGPSGGIFDSRFVQSGLNAQMSSQLFGPGLMGGFLGPMGGLQAGPLQFGLNMFGMQGPMDWLQTGLRNPSRGLSNIGKSASSIGRALGRIGGIF